MKDHGVPNFYIMALLARYNLTSSHSPAYTDISQTNNFNTHSLTQLELAARRFGPKLTIFILIVQINFYSGEGVNLGEK